MTDNPLVKKMKLKPGQHAAIINAPDGYLDSLQPVPEDVEVMEQLGQSFDWVQLFVKNQAELEQVIAQVRAALKPSGTLWITFPKGTSKIQTDLTRDKGWDALRSLDLKWINLISVDDTWSAFSLRPYKPGEERQTFR
ncbi:MAG TPA: hypothetical protein VKE41_07305 [Roseiflexaceae bacterium]|nr:hypothetical protein [Roseiflexaceae bacterium]